MKLILRPIGKNMTELVLGHILVLFSYDTPVAYFDAPTLRYYRTDTYHSKTTTRHINKWLNGQQATTVTQDHLNSLLVV